jgi:hypothetical protein
MRGVIASCDDSGVSLEIEGSDGKNAVYVRFEDIRRGNLLYTEERGAKKGGAGTQR